MEPQFQSSNVADQRFAEFIASGSQQALSEALLSAAPELLQRARWLTSDAEVAMDLVQATLLAAIESRARFDPERRFVPWLIGILENLHRYWQRRHARTVDAERITPPDDQDPFVIVHRKVLRETIDAAVAALPAPYGEVVTPYLHDQMPPEQIARSLGRPPSTVRTQLWRGLRLLRTRLPEGLALSAWALVASQAAAAERNATTATDAGASNTPDPQAGATRKVPLRRSATLLRLSCALVLVCGLLGIGLWFGAAHDPLPALAAAPTGGGAAVMPIASALPAADPTHRELVTASAAPTAKVRVRLRWESDGSPAAGQSLRLSTGPRGTSLLQTWFAHVREGWSDGHGEVVFDDVPHGRARLLLDDALVSTELTVSGDVERELILAPTAQIEGDVVDADGQPAPGADVWLTSTEGFGSPGYVATRAGADGRFVCATLTPRWTIWATAPGQGCALQFQEKDAGLVARPRLVLTGPAVPLRGAVEDGAGRPVAGATIGVFTRKRTTVAADRGFLPPQYQATDQDGRFAFAHLPRGSFFVVARDARHRAHVQIVECVEPDELVRVVLEHEGATIHGRILVPLDPNASLIVSAAPVIAAGRTGANGLLGSLGLVAPDGTYELRNVHPGTVDIRVIDRRPVVSAGISPISLTVVDGETVERDLGERRVLKGRVVDEQGTAVAGVTVSALPEGCDWQDFYWSAAEGVTDSKGEFRLALANDLPHVCQIREGAPQGKGFTWTIGPPCESGSAPVVLTLPSRLARGTLRGILSPEWTSGKTDVHLVQLPMRQRLQLPVDRDGRFELDQLPPGRYAIFAFLPGGRTRHEVAAFDLGAGQALKLDPIAVPVTGILDLTIERPDGARVQLTRRIYVHTAANDLPVSAIEELDSRGHGELHVGPGDYQVHVFCRDALPISPKVTVSAGQTTKLDILVQPVVPCVFRLEPPVNVSTARAVLQISDQHGTLLVREVLSAGDLGHFTLEIGLPVGPAHVRAVTSHGETVATEIQVEAPPAPAVFRLEMR